MNKDLFAELVESVREGDAILRGEKEPSRTFVVISYVDWDSNQWQDFALGQLFREDDEVEYSLEDAQEVYHP